MHEREYGLHLSSNEVLTSKESSGRYVRKQICECCNG